MVAIRAGDVTDGITAVYSTDPEHRCGIGGGLREAFNFTGTALREFAGVNAMISGDDRMNRMNRTHPAGPDKAMVHGDDAAMISFVADCMEDPALRSKAVSDPAGTLAERGIALPEGVDVRLVVNSGDTLHVVLPPDPNAVLEDEELGGVAGGATAVLGQTAACCSSGYGTGSSWY